MTVYLHSLEPQCIAELCVPAADVAMPRQLCSTSRELANLPRFNMTNYGERAFSLAGPYVWTLELTSCIYCLMGYTSALIIIITIMIIIISSSNRIIKHTKVNERSIKLYTQPTILIKVVDRKSL